MLGRSRIPVSTIHIRLFDQSTEKDHLAILLINSIMKIVLSIQLSQIVEFFLDNDKC